MMPITPFIGITLEQAASQNHFKQDHDHNHTSTRHAAVRWPGIPGGGQPPGQSVPGQPQPHRRTRCRDRLRARRRLAAGAAQQREQLQDLSQRTDHVLALVLWRDAHQPKGSDPAHHDALPRLLSVTASGPDCLSQCGAVRARQGVGRAPAQSPVATLSWQTGAGPRTAVPTQ